MDLVDLIHAKRARPLRRAGLLVVSLMITCGLLAAPVPSASAQQCPDVEVTFARGTGEPPGIGGVGRAFVDSLRSQVGSKSVGVYPVNYAASANIANPMQFTRTVVDGIRDENAHVESMAASCPNTKMVLGGYSQGAALTGLVTSADTSPGIPANYVTYLAKPMPPEIANHVAAVALFGNPSKQWLSQFGAPPIVIGPLYASKTIQLCAPGDTVCDGAFGAPPTVEHTMYPVNGMTGQAASFAASRL